MRLAGIDVDAAPELIFPILLAALVVLAGLAARLARGATSRWLSSKPAVSIPVACAVVIGGSLWIPDIGLPGRLGRWLQGALDIGFVLACALVVSRMAVAAVTEYATRNPSMSPAVGVARVSVRLLVGALAIITALETLGVPVAPLVTTLGVGSLAVALALQETLANFFAGLYLLADRPVRAGDYIKINDAQGKRGTWSRSAGGRRGCARSKNNTVIVPNQKLSQAILTNFHLPAAPVGMAVNVVVALGRGADGRRGRLNDELARAAAELPSLIRGKPAARLIESHRRGPGLELRRPGRRHRGAGARRTRGPQASAGAAAARGDRARRPGAAHARKLGPGPRLGPKADSDQDRSEGVSHDRARRI